MWDAILFAIVVQMWANCSISLLQKDRLNWNGANRRFLIAQQEEYFRIRMEDFSQDLDGSSGLDLSSKHFPDFSIMAGRIKIKHGQISGESNNSFFFQVQDFLKKNKNGLYKICSLISLKASSKRPSLIIVNCQVNLHCYSLLSKAVYF